MRVRVRAQMVAHGDEQFAVLLRRDSYVCVGGWRARIVVAGEQRACGVAHADHRIERRTHADRMRAELERLAFLGRHAIAHSVARSHDAADAARIRDQRRRCGRSGGGIDGLCCRGCVAVACRACGVRRVRRVCACCSSTIDRLRAICRRARRRFDERRLHRVHRNGTDVQPHRRRRRAARIARPDREPTRRIHRNVDVHRRHLGLADERDARLAAGHRRSGRERCRPRQVAEVQSIRADVETVRE